jgi:hypothetical protein
VSNKDKEFDEVDEMKLKEQFQEAERWLDEDKKWMEVMHEEGKVVSLATDIVLRYMLIGSRRISSILNQARDKLILLIIPDFVIYEALACLKKDEFNEERIRRLQEIIFIARIDSCPKIKIEPKRIEHLREVAMEIHEDD